MATDASDAGNSVREFEVRYRGLRTGRVWVRSVTVVPVRDADGHVTGTVRGVGPP